MKTYMLEWYEVVNIFLDRCSDLRTPKSHRAESKKHRPNIQGPKSKRRGRACEEIIH